MFGEIKRACKMHATNLGALECALATSAACKSLEGRIPVNHAIMSVLIPQFDFAIRMTRHLVNF